MILLLRLTIRFGTIHYNNTPKNFFYQEVEMLSCVLLRIFEQYWWVYLLVWFYLCRLAWKTGPGFFDNRHDEEIF